MMETILNAKTKIMMNTPACIVNAQQPSLVPVKVVKKEKAKRKNSEKRKEKSRKAARERRSQEAQIFEQIEEILPVSSKILDHLDKASLVRIAINYLKIRSVVDPFKVPSIVDCFDSSEASFLNTLNGFMFVLSKDGDIIYLSENVERFLGLNQIDLMGQSIYDYSHPCDHDDIKSLLEPSINAFNASKLNSPCSNNNTNNNVQANGIKKIDEQSDNEECENVVQPKKLPFLNEIGSEQIGPYFIRMKCTLTNKGRNLNLKSANYKVIKCIGRLVDLEMANPKHASMIGENYRQYMVVVGEVIQHPNRMDTPLKSDTFVSKHLPDMKFVYVDESVKELFGYDVNDLIGTTFYQYFDANDFTQLSILFKTLFAKGQCDFGQYKFLVKTGGYRWISTQATIINEPNSNQPQSIILIHRIISNIEDGHILTSNVQKPIATTSALSISNAPKSIPSISVSEITSNTPIFNPSAISATSLIVKAVSNRIPAEPATTESLFETNQKTSELSSNVNDSVPNILNNNNNPQTKIQPSPVFKVKVEEEQESNELSIQQQIGPAQSVTEQFISSTETVLAPKTADMESGFLVFTEDNKSLTVLSDADDLTHLAPDAGDLSVPMMPDMDFVDMNIFDEIFLNSTSFNITTNGVNGSGTLSEDEFLNNLASLDNEKLKLDGLDCFNLEFDNGPTSSTSSSTMKKFPNENLLGIVNNKDLKTNVYNQQYPLDVNSNDPFLSFTNSNNNDEFLINNDSPTNQTSSDCSLQECSSFISNSPMNSSSSNSLQFSPKSMSCDESSRLCDSDEKDLEMRAPFIPIDDDFLLNDFIYSNIDDLFDWVSNNSNNNESNNNFNNHNSNNNNLKPNLNGGIRGDPSSCPMRRLKDKIHNNNLNNNNNNDNNSSCNSNDYSKNKASNLSKLNGGCLEALLQNDELICNLKNKMYSSNQILNRPEQVLLNSPASVTINNDNVQLQNGSNNNNNERGNIAFSAFIADPNSNKIQTTTAMKRKNSNIFVYTTMSNTGEKKIKNLILTPEIPAHKLNNVGAEHNQQPATASIHHFVLTKNNELIPKVTFVNQQQQQQLLQQQQQQSFKVPKRLLTTQEQLQTQFQQQQLPLALQQECSTPASVLAPPHSNGLPIMNGVDHHHHHHHLNNTESTIKENVFKKPRSESVKNFSSNSVLLNLLVNGSDLSNGYELTHSPTTTTYSQSQQHPHQTGIIHPQKQPDQFLVANRLTTLAQ